MPTTKHTSDEPAPKKATTKKTAAPKQTQQKTAGMGSHFAGSSAPAKALKATKAVKVTKEAKKPGAAAFSKHPAVRITGASGEMPKVPMRVQATATSEYSRYNNRYAKVSGPEAVSASSPTVFSTAAPEGQPAYSWKPFMLYAGVTAALSLVWLAGALVLAPGGLVAGDLMMTAAIVLLCLIVCAGICLIVLTVGRTRSTDPALMTSDVVASALGKGSIAMLMGIVAWIAVLAVATFVV